MRVIVRRAVAILAMALGAAAIAAPGEYWDSTTRIEMPGMPMAMPPQTFKFCMARGLEKDPRSGMDKDCQLLESKMSGNKASFKMRCVKNGETMTGAGEMTFGPESSDGRMTLTMSQGTVTMLYSTKRVGGACDSDENLKQAQARVAPPVTGAPPNVDLCSKVLIQPDILVEQAGVFLDKDAACPSRKAEFCNTVTRSGSRNPRIYFKLKDPQAQTTLRSCGTSIETLRKSLCKELASVSPEIVNNMGDEFFDANTIKSDCPGEYKIYSETMRKRFCEGRDYTEKQRLSVTDCLAGKETTEAMARPQQAPQAQQPAQSVQPQAPANNNPAQDLLDGAKKLKGLFGL